jgi:hypothetical protein
VGDAKGVSPLRKKGVGGSVILKCVLRKYENLNGVWVFLFQDRNNVPAVVIFVINFLVL